MSKITLKFIPKSLVPFLVSIREKQKLKKLFKEDINRFIKYSFGLYININSYEQLEARITKAYHSIEKGFSYENIRLEFGKEAIENLLSLMDVYIEKGYSLDSECYKTALSNLSKYVNIHDEAGINNQIIERIRSYLHDKVDDSGGVLVLDKDKLLEDSNKEFISFSHSRHSVRNFSNEPVSLSKLEQAIMLAQNTPSACNRQGWKIRIASSDKAKTIIEKNQNGNKGFGGNIDKYILITTDSQYFQKPRERNQPYIDGGMYAMNLLYCLHFYGIATIPLSASLTSVQEKNIRTELKINNSENFILIIGIGNYTDTFKVPKSTRRKPTILNL